MTVWRTLFLVLLGLSIALAWKILPKLQIDTNLADVSPKTKNSPQTQDAIQTLRNSIEQRVILLIQGDDEDQVFDAEQSFRSGLALLPEITVLPDNEELIRRLLGGLNEYRFSLLSDAQQETLDTNSSAQIARQAQQNLYKMANGAPFFSFEEDPLGWHNETFLSLLDSSQSGLNNKQPSNAYAITIALKIDRGAMNMTTQEIITKHLNSLANQVKGDFSVVIERSGVFFFAADAAKNAKHDISLISIVSSIGVVVLLLFAFATLRALLLPLVSILLGVGFAFLVTHAVYGKVHVLTIVFGASLIGIVIDYSLHYFYHRSDSSDESSSNAALHRALFLSLMTSLIGYAALSFSELAALQKVAFFSCCGLLMAWLSVICLGELATRKPILVNQTLFPKITSILSQVLGRVPGRVWGVFAIFIVLAASIILKFGTPFSDDPRVFFKASSALLASEKKVAAVANDFEPGRYLVINGLSNDQIYTRYQQLIQAIDQTSTFDPTDLSNLLAWIPSAKHQHQNYLRQAKLYSSNGAATLLSRALAIPHDSIKQIQKEYQSASSLLLSPEVVSNLFGDALPPFWISSKDKNGQTNIVNFVLIQKGVNADNLATITSNLVGVEYVNTLERTQNALAEQRTSASKLLFIAYLLIAVVIVIRYRSVFALWLLVIPICASAGFVVVCTIAGISLNLFHTMALFLVLGFGMDYTIFTKEMDQHSSLQRQLTLQAILLSALTSVLSFGLLTISSIPVVSSFGLTLLVGNVFNLLGVFIASQILIAKRQ